MKLQLQTSRNISKWSLLKIWTTIWVARYKFDKEGKIAWIGQTHLIKKLEQKFGEIVSGMQSHATPVTHTSFPLPKEGEIGISREEHEIFRSRLRMLLYLMKYSRNICKLRDCRQKLKPTSQAVSKKYWLSKVFHHLTFGLLLKWDVSYVHLFFCEK